MRYTEQVEADDFSQELYRNVNMGTGNPLYDRRGKQSYVSVLQGQLRYSSDSREAASAKFTYVVSEGVCSSDITYFSCRRSIGLVAYNRGFSSPSAGSLVGDPFVSE